MVRCENNRSAKKNKFKNKVEFSLPFEGCIEETLKKQNEAENDKSSLLG